MIIVSEESSTLRHCRHMLFI